jgi:hypothetical protein
MPPLNASAGGVGGGGAPVPTGNIGGFRSQSVPVQGLPGNLTPQQLVMLQQFQQQQQQKGRIFRSTLPCTNES